MNKKNKIIVFDDKKIRRIWYEEEWFFSVVDVVGVLSESSTPRQYWGKVKDREFNEVQLSPIWVQLKLEAPDGKMSKGGVQIEHSLLVKVEEKKINLSEGMSLQNELNNKIYKYVGAR